MVVDFRSDTVTRPTPGMLEAMLSADVGDDVLGDDPTVTRLEAQAAAITGKEAALFVPSGTMGNQIAIRLHTQPGDEVLMYDGAHPFHYEAAGAAAISGVQLRLLPADRGILQVETVVGALRGEDPYFAPATLLCLEDTSNRGGGMVYPRARLEALCDAAHERGLAVHLDGARLFNAVVQSGVPVAERVSKVDTVTFCLSKGLGAPVGSMLCGTAAAMHRARRVRKMLGGGMRQAGYLAAAGLYALDHHVQRLADDHRRARTLASGLRNTGFAVRESVTNMVYVDVPQAPSVQVALERRGVRCFHTSPNTLRLVTHLDVDDAGIEHALSVFAEIRTPLS